MSGRNPPGGSDPPKRESRPARGGFPKAKITNSGQNHIRTGRSAQPSEAARKAAMAMFHPHAGKAAEIVREIEATVHGWRHFDRAEIDELPLATRVSLARAVLTALGVTIEDLRPISGAP
jgi:hypothetical protein